MGPQDMRKGFQSHDNLSGLDGPDVFPSSWQSLPHRAVPHSTERSNMPHGPPAPAPPKKKRARGTKHGNVTLHFVNISDHRELKTSKFKSNIRRHVMTNYMSKRKQEFFEKVAQVREKQLVPHPGVNEVQPVVVIKTPPTEWADSNQDGELVCSVVDAPIYWALCHSNLRNRLGYKSDPFDSLPFTSSKWVNIPLFKYENSALFDTEDVKISSLVARGYTPLQDLANVCVGTSCMDILNGLSVDSKETTIMKNEVMSMVRRRLEKNESLALSEVMIVATSLINADLLSSDGLRDAVTAHATGLDKMVEELGGLSALASLHAMGQKGGYVNYIALCMFKYHIFNESIPSRSYLDFVPLTGCLSTKRAWDDDPSSTSSHKNYYIKRGNKMGYIAQLSEPSQEGMGIEYLPLRKSSRCSRLTHDLLCDLRQATNIFLGIGPQSSSFSSLEDRQKAIHDFLCRVKKLPSAFDPASNNPAKNDWIYECVRLTCVLYFTALHHRIPFSEANHLLAQGGLLSYPSTEFVSALKRTNFLDCWNDLSAFLCLCCYIMAAGARPFIGYGDYKDIVARRWVVFIAIKCATTLLFEPSTALLGIFRILLEVQMRLSQTILPDPGTQYVGQPAVSESV